jgi:hypothetical protein
MRLLNQNDVIGARIIEVILSMPDKPMDISRESISASQGYLRLDNSFILDLSSYELPIFSAEEENLSSLSRDTKYEQEFAAVIGQQIVDVVLSEYLPSICIMTRARLVVTNGWTPAWVGPCLMPKDSYHFSETEPLWKPEV